MEGLNIYSQYLYSLDQTTGHWQVKMSDESREKKAFATRKGLF